VVESDVQAIGVSGSVVSCCCLGLCKVVIPAVSMSRRMLFRVTGGLLLMF